MSAPTTDLNSRIICSSPFKRGELVLFPKVFLDADLRLLETGAFSDFTVICGKKQWKTHRSILSRCPWFDRVVSEKSGFKEAQESKVTIHGFEEYEISWLLRYIYCPTFLAEDAQNDSPNLSLPETCVLLWSIGDYFCIEELANRAQFQLGRYCRMQSPFNGKIIDLLSTIPAIEAAVRAAWRQDRMAGPARVMLSRLCVEISTFLHDEKSNVFTAIMIEIPEFSAHMVQTYSEYLHRSMFKLPRVDISAV